MLKLKPSCQYLSDLVRFMMKAKQGNDVTDRTGVIYVENDNEPS